MAKEIRVTFTDKEIDLYNFINSKSSKTGFLKDLAKMEKERQENITNSNIDYEKLVETLISKFQNIENRPVTKEIDVTKEDEIINDESKEDDIINNMDFSDLS